MTKFNFLTFILISEHALGPIFAEKSELNESKDIRNSFLDCPEGEFCWPKCCDSQAYFNMDEMKCEPTNDSALLKPPDIYQFYLNDTNFPMLALLPIQNITSFDRFGRILSKTYCNGSMSFIYPRAFVNILSDGRLYVDNRDYVEIYETGFCFEKFVDQKWRVSSYSAFICFPFEPVISFPSPNKIAVKKTACHHEFDNQVYFNTNTI